MKIRCRREDVETFVPEVEDLVAWIEAQDLEKIHNFLPRGSILLGADWPVDHVLKRLRKDSRVVVTTGKALQQNVGHAISVVDGEFLYLFDVGDLEPHLEVLDD